MVNQMDEEGFGNCTNTGACEVECPKGISLDNIARMNREFLSDDESSISIICKFREFLEGVGLMSDDTFDSLYDGGDIDDEELERLLQESNSGEGEQAESLTI